MSQEVVRYFGQHMARLYADTSSRTGQDWDDATPASEDRESASVSPDEERQILEAVDEFTQVSGLVLTDPHLL